MIDLDNPKFIVWGYRNHFTTHQPIHAAFYRALKNTGRDVLWLDSRDDLSSIDFDGRMVISEHTEAKRGMPINDLNFYVIHGLNDDPDLSNRMRHIKNRLSWNVFHDFSHGNSAAWDGQPIDTVEDYDKFLTGKIPDTEHKFDRVFLDTDTTYYHNEKHMEFRWATDLLPDEIEANKPAITLTDTPIIYWVGTQWVVNQRELTGFKKACNENHVEFRAVGAGQNGVVTMEDNIRLVRESLFSPAVVGSHHVTEGYAPCRIFKNISYGRMGITNSKRVNDIFGGRLIFNEDPYRLFYDAKEQLQSLPVERIHELMDFVAEKHTYLNRIESILKAARLVMETR